MLRENKPRLDDFLLLKPPKTETKMSLLIWKVKSETHETFKQLLMKAQGGGHHVWETDFPAVREVLQVHRLSRMGQDGGRMITSIVTTGSQFTKAIQPFVALQLPESIDGVLSSSPQKT